MNTATVRTIDFEFTFQVMEKSGENSIIYSWSAEGLKAALIFKTLPPGSCKMIPKQVQSVFAVWRNPQFFNETRFAKKRGEIEIILWHKHNNGRERFLVRCVPPSDGVKFVPSAGALLQARFGLPKHFFMKPGKKIKVSVHFPSEVFVDQTSKKKMEMHIPPHLRPIPKVTSPPKFEDFEKTPLHEALMNDKVPTDFTLISSKDEKEVKCHQSVLFVTGEFFQKIIENSLDPGKKRNSVTLPFSRKTLELLKRYIYTRKISFGPEDDMEEVVDAGTMMMFPVLVRKCEKYIMANLNNMDKYDMLMLARTYGLENMKSMILPLCPKDAMFREKMRRSDDLELFREYTEYLSDKVKLQL